MDFTFNHKQTFRSATDLAYQKVKKRILNLELYPDELIVESILAKELDISRTPLREALTKLQHDNLIIKQSNGRLKIAPISVKEAKEVFQVRAQLEGIATREATELAEEGDIDHLQSIVHSIQHTYQVNNVEGILYYGEKFHFYIYYLSGGSMSRIRTG